MAGRVKKIVNSADFEHLNCFLRQWVRYIERLKPAPPFTHVMHDLFGPYPIRGKVQKRVTDKGYGVIFTDFFSRTVHIEEFLVMILKTS